MANIPARACPLAKKCGGCQLQNLSYDEQRVAHLLRRRNDLAEASVHALDRLNGG